jgi:ribonuclease P protein component
MRRSDDFTTAVRRGRRVGRSTLVGHLAVPPETGTDAGSEPALVGFVVSRAVGNAVVRNAVRRRLRHLVSERLPGLAPGSLLVVRAQPPAATATSEELARDLDAVLHTLSTRGRDRAVGESRGRSRP